METINYQAALNLFQNHPPIQIQTLGRRKNITVDVLDNKIRITNSEGNSKVIDEAHWISVIDRINQIDEEYREMATRYSQGTKDINWNECPNRIFSPYVPAVIRELHGGNLNF